MVIAVVFLCYIKFIGIPAWIVKLPETSNADFAIVLVISLLAVVGIFQLPNTYKGQVIIKLKFFTILGMILGLMGMAYYIIMIGIPQ